MSEKNKSIAPERMFQSGNCFASVFVNKLSKDGQELEIKTVTLQKGYKDKDDQWQNNKSFNRNDLPKIIEPLRKLMTTWSSMNIFVMFFYCFLSLINKSLCYYCC